MEFKFGHLYPSLSYLRCGHFYFPTYIFSADMWFMVYFLFFIFFSFYISFFFFLPLKKKCMYKFSASHLFTHRPLGKKHFYITSKTALPCTASQLPSPQCSANEGSCERKITLNRSCKRPGCLWFKPCLALHCSTPPGCVHTPNVEKVECWATFFEILSFVTLH